MAYIVMREGEDLFQAKVFCKIWNLRKTIGRPDGEPSGTGGSESGSEGKREARWKTSGNREQRKRQQQEQEAERATKRKKRPSAIRTPGLNYLVNAILVVDRTTYNIEQLRGDRLLATLVVL